MIEILPAILVKTCEELKQRVAEVEPFVNRFHLDIMDGVFVPNKTIQPGELKEFRTRLSSEAHLMVSNCTKYVNEFLGLEFDMIIVHKEPCSDHETLNIIDRVRGEGRRIGLAINPATPISAIEKYLDDIDTVLVMTVNPGYAGEDFDVSMLPKIRMLRELKGDLDIEVDGGIKVGTARLAAVAGANIFASCSGIYGFKDKQKMIELLKADALL